MSNKNSAEDIKVYPKDVLHWTEVIFMQNDSI
jgi:hypothetical protein